MPRGTLSCEARRALRKNESHFVYLVPGFFGFANLGDLPYFAHVSEYITDSFTRRGLDVHVFHVHTLPTASLRQRAARLLDRIAATAEEKGPIHVIGHSSGGLDARLLLTPGVALPSDREVEQWAARVRTLVTVGTPHHGTPVASFFTGLLGQRLLQILSLFTIYTIRFGKLPIDALGKLVRLFTHLDNMVGRDKKLIDQIFGQLLGDFSADRQELLRSFFAEVKTDQALLPQLTPDSMDTFNASTADRPAVRYGSVVTRGRAPGLRSRLAAGLDPYAHATRAVYGAMYRLSTRMPAIRINELRPEYRADLERAYDRAPDWRSSDGVVPTLSQPWGDLICAVNADHLDVIGHFHAPQLEPPHFDWLASGTGFSRSAFNELWRRVVDFVLDD